MGVVLTDKSKVIADCSIAETEPVQIAASHLCRDLQKAVSSGKTGSPIRLVADNDEGSEPESYRVYSDGDSLVVAASDHLGFIYGLYAISRELLGIQDFWFWNDQEVVPTTEIRVSDAFHLQSAPSKVRFRGWFINDEVLFFGWKVGSDELGPWKMAFESLLRLGGNTVIPGTGQLDTSRYEAEATRCGLVIAQHHAEPLGAEMFSRAHPDLVPSYEEHPDLFEGLWRSAIEKRAGSPTIWSLGFRGQGDLPFWENDPRYETDEERGRLLTQILRTQHGLVEECAPGSVCAINLYGETLELYRTGHLEIPDDVVKIWADNGYGAMVSRRQGLHNPRVPSMPIETEKQGANGIYYHASFYDLQAGYTLTMLPSPPREIIQELQMILANGMNSVWLINCSAVRPHTYPLDFIAEMWRRGEVDVSGHREKFAERYFGSHRAHLVSRLYEEFFHRALKYGEHWDERAGEQLPNCVSRDLITNYLKESASTPSTRVSWLLDQTSFEKQVETFRVMCEEAVKRYGQYLCSIEERSCDLSKSVRRLLAGTLGLQASILECSYRGAAQVASALELGLRGDYRGAFMAAGAARKHFLEGYGKMRHSERGDWKGFYKNDAQADLTHSAWMAETLMAYMRVQGDGPDFVTWQREALYSEENRNIWLLMTVEKHLDNPELWEAMRAKTKTLS